MMRASDCLANCVVYVLCRAPINDSSNACDWIPTLRLVFSLPTCLVEGKCVIKLRGSTAKCLPEYCSGGHAGHRNICLGLKVSAIRDTS